MMAREQRASTLIDPASLQTRPMSKQFGSSKPPQTLSRQNSLSMKPLLNFEDEERKTLQPPLAAGRLPLASRSVFGVDTLWEREMVKLKEIEAREAREKEERLKREEETERKSMGKKNKRKKKGRKNPKDDEDVQEVLQEVPANVRVSVEPPILPDFRRAPRTVPLQANAYDSSESEEEGEQHRPDAVAPAWHENSSDEEDGPRRTTGIGLRYPKHFNKNSLSHDDDSEEDLPLAATIHKAAARATLGVTQMGQDSDDEDRPLSHIVLQAKTKLPPPRTTLSAENRPAEEDDDDEPLGLRTSRFIQNRPSADDEDDVPLAFHPEQQRRTQYQMLAQQQQQQQQMMMQAQMQSNMLMSASMMGPGYFAPMVHPMGMMQVPMPLPSPPLHDEVKFGRVDRWRRDIVVDE